MGTVGDMQLGAWTGDAPAMRGQAVATAVNECAILPRRTGATYGRRLQASLERMQGNACIGITT